MAKRRDPRWSLWCLFGLHQPKFVLGGAICGACGKVLRPKDFKEGES